MASYLIETESYGRTERRLDVNRFAHDLAAAFDGASVSAEASSAWDRGTTLALPDHLQMHVWNLYGAGNQEKVSLSLFPTDVPRDLPRYGEQYQLPTIHVTTSRPMPQIVADIKRRLIAPSAAPLAALRDLARQRSADRDTLASQAAALRRDFPAFLIREDNNCNVSLFSNGARPYLAARVYGSGEVTIDRIGSLSAEQFRAICRILYPDAGTAAAAE